MLVPAACPRWLAAPWRAQGVPGGQATEEKTITRNRGWKGKRRSRGRSCPRRKGSTWEGKWVLGPETNNKGRARSLSSAGRGRLNKVNKKRSPINFVLKPMNLDERPKGERLGCYQWHNFSSLLLKRLQIKPLRHNGTHFLQGGKHSKSDISLMIVF